MHKLGWFSPDLGQVAEESLLEIFALAYVKLFVISRHPGVHSPFLIQDITRPVLTTIPQYVEPLPAPLLENR